MDEKNRHIVNELLTIHIGAIERTRKMKMEKKSTGLPGSKHHDSVCNDDPYAGGNGGPVE